MGAYNVINRASMAAGQPEDITQVLANFDAIAAILNGNLDDSNIKAAAAIALSKLSGYPADGTMFAAGDGTWKVPPASGGVTVATTIAGLGAGSAGKQGRLRLGAAPYEFVDLIYDVTYGKWVSAPRNGWNVSAIQGGSFRPFTTTGSVATGSVIGIGYVSAPNFTDAVAAGLTPQFRATGLFQNSVNQITEVLLEQFHYGANNGVADEVDLGRLSSQNLAWPGAAGFTGFDTGWVSIANPGAPKATVAAGLSVVNAASAAIITFIGMPMMRWVG